MEIINGVECVAGSDINDPDIDGGTIDGTVIGNITPAAGNFTTLEVSTDPVDANGVGGRAFTDGRYCLETNNLSDLSDVAVSFHNIKQVATESESGVLEKATTGEVVVGTDTDRVVTPAGVSARMDDPGHIGGVVPAAGSFTTLSAESFLKFSGSPQVITGPGAVNLTTAITHLVTEGADAYTLADGIEGQIKIIIMKTDGGNGSLTPANSAVYSSYTFEEVGDGLELLFSNGLWIFMGGTIARVL